MLYAGTLLTICAGGQGRQARLNEFVKYVSSEDCARTHASVKDLFSETELQPRPRMEDLDTE